MLKSALKSGTVLVRVRTEETIPGGLPKKSLATIALPVVHSRPFEDGTRDVESIKHVSFETVLETTSRRDDTFGELRKRTDKGESRMRKTSPETSPLISAVEAARALLRARRLVAREDEGVWCCRRRYALGEMYVWMPGRNHCYHVDAKT